MPSAPHLRRLAVPLLCLLVGAVAAPAALAIGPLDVGERRVVVVPLNLGIDAVAEVSPGIEPVTRELLLHLKERGHRVATLERDSAAKLWREVLAEARADDPRAGVHQVYARYAAAVAEQVDFGALVFPSLVMRAARVQGETARWDGVDRHVPVPRFDDEVTTHRDGPVHIYSYGGQGELAAASLHVAVFEPDGALRFEGAGGLSVLQKVDRLAAPDASGLVTSLRDDAFADPIELREGIEAAFARTLAAVPASQAH